jgi:taurine dioxygenase
MDRAESDALVDRLARAAETVEYQCRFRWEADSVAFWDNRSVQHYASSDYWPQRRVMERASIVGERPA